MKEKTDDFFIRDHASLSENLNRISDDLLKAKWYFLATIAALGLAYKYIYENSPFTSSFPWPLIVIFIIGNIILWLISEYTLSHGFLFRYIQSKLAQIEDYFYKMLQGNQKNDFRRLTKDPRKKENFITSTNDNKERLFFDYMLPDQFMPIYWASFWAIVINSMAAYAIYKLSYKCDSYPFILGIIIFISSIFVWKLWNYHIYKIKQFIKNFCEFQFFVKMKKKNSFEMIDFFNPPFLAEKNHYRFFILLIILLVSFIVEIFVIKKSGFFVLLAFSVVMFWPVAIGTFIHIIHNLLRIIGWDEWRFFTPLVSKPDKHGKREVFLKPEQKVLKKICWIWWLLFFIV